MPSSWPSMSSLITVRAELAAAVWPFWMTELQGWPAAYLSTAILMASLLIRKLFRDNSIRLDVDSVSAIHVSLVRGSSNTYALL